MAVVVVVVGLAAFLLTRGSGGGNPAVGAGPKSGTVNEGTSATGAAIETSVGTLRIDKVEVTDSWPPGCTPSVSDPSCQRAEPGYKVVSVWLGAGSADLKAASDEIIRVYHDLYVTDSAGVRTKGFAGGMLDRRLVVSFTTSESSSGFTLLWPGNDPIKLGSI